MALGIFLKDIFLKDKTLSHQESIQGFAIFDYYPGALLNELRRGCDLLIPVLPLKGRRISLSSLSKDTTSIHERRHREVGMAPLDFHTWYKYSR